MTGPNSVGRKEQAVMQQVILLSVRKVLEKLGTDCLFLISYQSRVGGLGEIGLIDD